MISEETHVTGKWANTEKNVLTKETMANRVHANFRNYFQKYKLSCEAALIRLVCGALGIVYLSEEEILKLFPLHPANPELGLVMKEIDGDSMNPDGTANWQNYGAHAAVVCAVLDTILKDNQLSGQYTLEIVEADNAGLQKIIKNDKNCLGAIVWVAADIDGKKPPVNALGQVLGEHVQYIAPLLDSAQRFLVYDVWPWKEQPFRLYSCLNRDLFDYKTIIIRSVPLQEAHE